MPVGRAAHFFFFFHCYSILILRTWKPLCKVTATNFFENVKIFLWREMFLIFVIKALGHILCQKTGNLISFSNNIFQIKL